MEAYARDMLAVLDACGIERAVLVGHSLGAYAVARFAADHPERVRAAVLVDGGLTLPGIEGVDPEAFLTAFLGPALARLELDIRHAARRTTRWWRAHPAFAGGDVADEDLIAYADHDLGGEPPAAALDRGQGRGAGRRARVVRDRQARPSGWPCPVEMLRAPRGLQNDPHPMIPAALAAAWAHGDPGRRRVGEVADVNHYTIVMGATGARAVAQAIVRAAANSGRRSCPTIRSMSSAGTVGAPLEPPEPDLTQEEMVARAVALRPRLVAEQEATEQRTYYSREMHEAFLAAGFYHLYVPRRYGGYEFDVPTYVRVVQEIARGCVSTAWCLGLAMNHALMVGSWWPRRPRTRSSPAATSAARRWRRRSAARRGPTTGWEINGQVAFASGVPWSTYYMGQALLPAPADAAPDDPPPLLLFVAPREEWEMLDDWGDMLGLKGSGSHSIRFDGTRIPAELGLRGQHARRRGRRRHARARGCTATRCTRAARSRSSRSRWPP